jgi:hypothetical protein
MNELGTTLVWLALQVTLVSLAAAGLYAALSRRGAGALAAGAGLAAAVALSAAALCPLPAWWDWGSSAAPAAEVAEAATLPSAAPHPGPALSVPAGSDGAAPVWSLSALRSVWANVGGAALRSASQHTAWPRWIALAFLLGTGAGGMRILVGLWGVRECRRRSERITDPALAALLEELRAEMRIARQVEARELSGLPAAATVGWLRPLILLPPDWREWGAEERRAVLAHELAHVRRGDYLAGLLARFGVALHFYHPLVYWLAARLHLQQELAADALGAGHAGGRGPYLKALARLALRQDARPVAWPARTFLSPNGTLMRRVHMLRTKDRFPPYRLHRAVRALAVAVLAAVALGVSALRSPAQKVAGTAQAAGERFYAGGFRSLRGFEFKAAAEREPFDLSYLAPDATGGVAVRPSAIFGRPGKKKYADTLNMYLALGSKAMGFREGLTLPFDQLEQVSASAFIKPMKGPEGKTALMLGQPVLRTAKDYDWKGRFIDLMPGVEEVSYHGRTYYKVPEGKMPALGPQAVCFYLPDGRTLVMLSEAGVRQVIDHKRVERRRFAWEDDWKEVERGLFAVAVDNSDKGWLKDRRPDDDLNEAELEVARHLNSLVQGVDGDTAFTVTAVGRCDSEAGARKVLRAAKELLGGDVVKELEKAAKEGPDGITGRECRCGLELLHNAHMKRDGECVRWTSTVQADLAELLGADLAEGASGQHKKK